MNLDWDYKKREIHISMLDYAVEALISFQHNSPKNCKINHIHTPSQNMEKRLNMPKINILPPSLENMAKIPSKMSQEIS